MSRLINTLLFILFFLLPLINSRLLNLFGVDLGWHVNGNYEFSKVIFFNVLSGIIIILFFIKNFRNLNNLKLNNKNLSIILSIISLLVISSLLSFSPYLSIFGNAKKAHSLIMFINLIGIFIILINSKKTLLKKLIGATIISTVILSIITIKEYFFPTFDYGELGNRAIGTFGHPSYIALFLLMIIPFIFNKHIIPSPLRRGLGGGILLIFTLFLTKSAWGIILFIFYSIYYFLKNNKYYPELDSRPFKEKKINYKTDSKTSSKLQKQKYLTYSLIIIILFFSSLIIFFLFPEKLHSFLSRFFIWETTLKIIFSDIKILLFGGGLETLGLTFDNYKSTYLYIFENIGFTADRPHNLILNIFYHTGIFGLLLSIYLIYLFLKNLKKSSYSEAIILFLLFTIFNFASIASYLLLVLFLAIYFSSNYQIIHHSSPITCHSCEGRNLLKYIIFLIITLISTLGIYFSTKFYIAENYVYKKNYLKALNTFPYNPNYYYKLGNYQKGLKIEKFKSENYYLSKIKSLDNIRQDCQDLTNNFSSAENYFYCGEILEELGYNYLSTIYYKLGLNKLPDLWNKNSKYYDNIIIKDYINGNRFFSEKYSNLKEILEKNKKID